MNDALAVSVRLPPSLDILLEFIGVFIFFSALLLAHSLRFAGGALLVVFRPCGVRRVPWGLWGAVVDSRLPLLLPFFPAAAGHGSAAASLRRGYRPLVVLSRCSFCFIT